MKKKVRVGLTDVLFIIALVALLIGLVAAVKTIIIASGAIMLGVFLFVVYRLTRRKSQRENKSRAKS